MTKYAYQQFVFTGTDDVAVAPFAAVTVTNASDDTPADIWEDADGLNQITGGELLADDEGYFIFYADAGTYNVTITSGSESKTLADVTIPSSGGGNAPLYRWRVANTAAMIATALTLTADDVGGVFWVEDIETAVLFNAYPLGDNSLKSLMPTIDSITSGVDGGGPYFDIFYSNGTSYRAYIGGAIIASSVNVASYGAVGDGVTYDDEAINAATLAAGVGGVVEFVSGKTYLLNSDIHVYSGQQIIGNGARLISAQPLLYMMRNHDVDQPNYEGGSNILITGLTFDNESVLRDCGFIGLAHTSNAMIRDCRFLNLNGAVYHAIDLPGNQFLTVENCYFYNCQGATTLQIDAATAGSITFYTAPQLETASGTRSKNITVRGNKFFECGTYSQAVHLHKKGHSYISIIGNEFRECYRAISDDLGSTYRANGATTDIIINDNIITTSLTGGGIFLDFVKRAKISGNIIQGSGGGIQVLNYFPAVTISSVTKANPAVVTTSSAHGFSNGNVVYINACAGMTQLNGNWYTVANVTADTFELTTVDAGANVNSTGYGTYTGSGQVTYRQFSGTYRNTDITISENQIQATNGDAIVVQNCNRAKVINNTITEYGEDDINRSGIDFDLVFPLDVRGNSVESTTSGTKQAVRLARCYQYCIAENRLDRGVFAVLVKKLNQAEDDDGRIVGNHFDLGTTYIIYLQGTSAYPIKHVTVGNNFFDGTFSGHCIRCDFGSNLVATGNAFKTVKAAFGAISFNTCNTASITGNTMEAAASSTSTAIAVYGSGSSGRASVVGNTIKGFNRSVDIATSSANYGTVVGNTFISCTNAPSVGAGVVVQNNSTV